VTDFVRTPLTTHRRGAARGSHDRARVHAILDEGIYCTVAFQADGHSHCVPMVYARQGDAIHLHGSTANHCLRALRDGARACVNVTLLDGLVLGRSAFRTSVNYRSVMIFATASEVCERAEKLEVLRSLIEGVVPGRWRDIRTPDERELAMSLVLRLPLVEVSAKVRSGPPIDLEDDYALPCWAGEIPLSQRAHAPRRDPRLGEGVPVPAYASAYRRACAPRRSR